MGFVARIYRSFHEGAFRGAPFLRSLRNGKQRPSAIRALNQPVPAQLP